MTYVDPPPIDIETHWRRGMAASDFKHLHLGGLLSIKRLGPLSEIARAQGATISMDCQDNPDLKNVCDWPELLALVDVFMPNAREAMLITGLSTVQGAVEQLAAWIDPIIVKDGANGVWIGHDGDVIHVRAIDAGPVIDTTGAGDCFNAGFLYGWVVERAPLSQAAVYGNICGGLSVTQVGGATAPTRAELLGWYARLSGGPDVGKRAPTVTDEVLLAIDNGTQSVRALLFDLRGNLLAKARADPGLSLRAAGLGRAAPGLLLGRAVPGLPAALAEHGHPQGGDQRRGADHPARDGDQCRPRWPAAAPGDHLARPAAGGGHQAGRWSVGAGFSRRAPVRNGRLLQAEVEAN